MKNPDYLIHYGVIGMKWGVRKSRPRSSGARPRTKKTKKITFFKKRKEKKAKKARQKAVREEYSNKKKAVKKMSDEELKDAIARLELEKKYKSLNQEKVSVGRKVVEDILQSSAKNVGMQLGVYILGNAVNKAAKKEIVNPKKGQKDKK